MRPLQTAYQAGSWALMNVVHLLGNEGKKKVVTLPNPSRCMLGNVSLATVLTQWRDFHLLLQRSCPTRCVFLLKQNLFVFRFFYLLRFTVPIMFFVFVFLKKKHIEPRQCWVSSFLIGWRPCRFSQCLCGFLQVLWPPARDVHVID